MKYKTLIFSLLATLGLGGGLATASYFYYTTTHKKKTEQPKVVTATKDLQLKHIADKLDKYELTQNTTNYTNWVQNNSLFFDEELIRQNLYKYMQNQLNKILEINDHQCHLNLHVFYKLNFNNDQLKIKLNWSKSFTNLINLDFVKWYYDTFVVMLSNLNKR
ncbi:hypothetical protein [Ureaplasma ceti]|uniref:Lipoprotein n=1 Tax=Ureaplasma ceti TaxID=3119530 RepID=A0ABP9UBV1_9BACT